MELDKEAQDVLDLAKEEAKRVYHNYIGTEHALVALTQNEDIKSLLQKQNIAPEKIRNTYLFVIGRGDKPTDEPNITPRLKKVLSLAEEEAKREQKKEITPGHIFAGIIKEGESVAAGILESCGFNGDV